jgi:hypothetical protein
MEHWVGDVHHDSKVEGAENVRSGHFLESRARRDALAALIVASGAVFLVNGLAGYGIGGEGSGPEGEKSNDERCCSGRKAHLAEVYHKKLSSSGLC